MSHSPLPKEQQSAYQRWEMASLEDPTLQAELVATLAPEEIAAQLAQLQIEQLALLQQQAHQQGLLEGQREGRAAGLIEGRAAAAQERADLLAIASSFTEEIARSNELIAADLLQLALDLARAMLKTALEVRPTLVLPIVTEAIRYLPTVQQPALLTLHPLDVELVTERLGTELSSAGWTIAPEANMQRGGCRVDTPSHHIDATLGGRWTRVAAALGLQSDWLAP